MMQLEPKRARRLAKTLRAGKRGVGLCMQAKITGRLSQALAGGAGWRACPGHF
jgi:hypothetical protein